MPIFRTGRTFTITASASFSGEFASFAQSNFLCPPPNHPDVHPDIDGSMSMQAFGGLLIFGVSRYVHVDIDHGTPHTLHVGAQSNVSTMAGSSTGMDSNSNAIPAIPCGSVGVAYEVGGAFSGSIDVEECIEIDYSDTDNPFWLGIADAPAYTTMRVFLRARVGGTTSASVSGAFGCSFSGTITSPVEVTWLASIDSNVTTGAGGSGTLSVSAPSFSLGGGVTVPLWTLSAGPDSEGSSATISSPCTATANCGPPTFDPVSGELVNDPSASAFITYQCRPTKNTMLSGNIYTADGGSYPDSLTFNAGGFPGTSTVTGSGSYSVSGSQVMYALVGGAMSTPGTGPNLDNWSAITTSITPTSLATQGEDFWPEDDPRITRVLIRGRSVPALTLFQASNVTLSPTWVGSDSDRTQTGTFAGGTGGTSLEQGASTYRYLRVRLRSVGGGTLPGTLTIPPSSVSVNTNPANGNLETDVYDGSPTPTKVWSFTTGEEGTYVDIDFDLCTPQSLGTGSDGDAVDTQDSLWPYPPRSPATMGVPRIGQIIVKFTGAPDATLEIDSVELVRKHATVGTVMGTFYRYKYTPGDEAGDEPSMAEEWPIKSGPDRQVAAVGTSTQNFIRRGFLAITDGHQGTETPDLLYLRTEGVDDGDGGTVSYDFLVQSVADLVAELNSATDNQYSADGSTIIGTVRRHPGTSATASTPTPTVDYTNRFDGDVPPTFNYYYNDSLPMIGLIPAFDIDLSGAHESSCVPLYDQVDYYPGYDYAEGGNYCLAILRGTAHGLVIARDTGSGAPIDLIQEDTGAIRGSGTSNSDGLYKTGAPTGHAGNLTHLVRKHGATSGGATLPAGDAAGAWYARHRHRAALVTQSVPMCRLLTGFPLTYFPFTPQFSDQNVLPLEEWRRTAADQSDLIAASTNGASDD